VCATVFAQAIHNDWQTRAVVEIWF